MITTNTVIALVVLVAVSTVVALDARANKIPTTSAKPYSLNTGALAWFVACVLLLIVALPFYLVRRSRVMRERRTPAQGGPWQDPAGRLEQLEELHARGLINEDEYQAKRAEVLAEI